jgi:hypothetical protein
MPEVPQHPNAQAICDAHRPPVEHLPALIWFSVSARQWPNGVVEALVKRNVQPEAIPGIIQWFMTPAFVGGFSLVSLQ